MILFFPEKRREISLKKMRLAIKLLVFLHVISICSYLLVIFKITNSVVQFKLIEVERGEYGSDEEITDQSNNSAKVSNATKILIVAYVRSGSTFTGDLVQQTPKSFFTFEPIASATTGVMRINESKFNEAFEILNDLFECKLRRFQLFHDRFKKYSRFKMSNFFRDSCIKKPSSCANPSSVKFDCESSPVRISKVVRLPMKAVHQFLSKHPELQKAWKILHLRRDPRGMFNSRSNRNWCDSSTCLNINGMCDEIREDLYYTEKIRKEFNKTLIASINYEKLVSDPINESIRMYQRLGIKYSLSVKSFVEFHTKSIDLLLKKHPYSTVRNSKETVTAWKTKLNPSVIKHIEDECSDVITKLGYQLIYNE